MKILFSLGSLNRGGAETLVLDILHNNSFFGSSQIYCSYRKEGVLQEDFLQSKVKLFDLTSSKNFISKLINVRKITKQERIDVIHSHQPLDAAIAIISTIGLGVKNVITYHGSGFQNNALGRFVNHINFNFANGIIFVSNFQKQQFINRYPKIEAKSYVIHNGINFQKLENFEFKSIREECAISKKELLISSVGNFIPGRNQILLCKLAKLLAKNSVDFKLLLVGKRVDEYADRYDSCVDYCERNNLEKNVLFLGVRADVPNILSQSDAFLYTSEHDTFGIAVVEAIASGIPVFVNDWDVMREITEDGKLVNLYKSKDEEDLLEKFMLFLQNKKAYKEQAVENAKMIRNKFGIEKHISELRTLYQSL